MDGVADLVDGSEKKIKKALNDIYLKLRKNQYEDALTSVADLINSNEGDSQLYMAYFYRGLLLQKIGNDLEAELAYQKVIELRPDFAVAYNNLAQLLTKREATEEVEVLYRKSLELDPLNFKTFYNLALFLLKVGKEQAALGALRSALVLAPDYQPARELVLRITDLKGSVIAFGEALKKDPDNARLYCELAIFYDLQTGDVATDCLKKIMKLKYLPSPAFLNYFALKCSRLYKTIMLAEKIYQYALESYSNEYIFYNNYSRLLLRLKKYDEALEIIEKAIELKPDNAVLYFTKCAVLLKEKRYDESILSAKLSIKLDPKSLAAFSLMTLSALAITDWELVEQCKHRVTNIVDEAISSGESIKDWNPFADLLISDDTDVYVKRMRRLALEISSKEKYTSYLKKNKKDKIRVGYISPDYTGNHPVGYMIKDIFSLHDSRQFETFGFGLMHFSDEGSQEIRDSFDHYLNLMDLGDDEAAKLIHDSGIDILVDLAGYTDGGRHGILSRQPAPIQIHYMGYTSSMQSEYIQYHISCKEFITKSLEEYFSEKIIFMPEGSVATRLLEYPKNDVTREDFGLPNDAVVFCCFNKSMRINEAVFVSWMRILKAVPNSVMWLFQESESMKKHLNSYAEQMGVDASRLIYLERCHLSDRWHHQLADLWLDTFLFSGGTGAVLCANVGLPVLTLAGKSPQSRIGAAVAAATKTPDMVCRSVKEYEKRAIDLGNHPEKLAMLKDQLIQNRQSMPLFNPKRLIRHFESAYQKIWHTYLAGKEPKSITIKKQDV